MKSRLFRKIFAAYAVTLLVVIVLDGFFVALQTRRDISRQIREELTTNGRLLQLVPIERIAGDLGALTQTVQARITLVNAKGTVMADSDGDVRSFDNHLNRPEIQEARIKGQGSAIRYSQTLGIDMMYVALPVREGKIITGYIRLAKPLRDVTSAIDRFYVLLFRAALIILTSFLLLAVLFIPKFIAPLLRITAYTQKVRDDEIPGSLIIHAQNEIGQLADNINLLVQKYEGNLRLAREEKRKLEAAFAGMTEGIMILDRENRIEFINRGMTDILGDRAGETTGRTSLAVFRNAELQDNLVRSLKTGEPVAQEIIFGDDNPQTLNVRIAPIKGSTGEKDKTIMVFHDVTQLRKLEQVRTDFVANVTHEIKTPLTAIIGFVETLQGGAINDEAQAQRFLSIIAEHGRRLNRLVDDLLILSSIELGDADLHSGEMHVGEALAKALTVVEAKAQEKGLAIVNLLPDDLPPILADLDSVVQILVNVLDNAVKFTASGSIGISASLDKEGYVAIMIADTGVGVPAYDIARLGERFYRVDKTRSRELGGTGLGLSIVKHLLMVQRGFLEVESTLGVGTVVKLFFPIYLNNEVQP